MHDDSISEIYNKASSFFLSPIDIAKYGSIERDTPGAILSYN